MDRRRLQFGIAAALVGVLLVGVGVVCGVRWERDRVARLDVSGLGISFGLDMTEKQDYASFYAGDLCLNRSGPAEILTVRSHSDPSGARVTGFTVLPHSDGRSGAEHGRLAEVPEFAHGTRAVVATCGHGTEELIVEAHRPHGVDVVLHDLTIVYRVGGRTRIARAEAEMGLCSNLDRGPCA
jgi:hypothetical protein